MLYLTAAPLGMPAGTGRRDAGGVRERFSGAPRTSVTRAFRSACPVCSDAIESSGCRHPVEPASVANGWTLVGRLSPSADEDQADDPPHGDSVYRVMSRAGRCRTSAFPSPCPLMIVLVITLIATFARWAPPTASVAPELIWVSTGPCSPSPPAPSPFHDLELRAPHPRPAAPPARRPPTPSRRAWAICTPCRASAAWTARHDASSPGAASRSGDSDTCAPDRHRRRRTDSSAALSAASALSIFVMLTVATSVIGGIMTPAPTTN